MEQQIISREEAREKGLKRYYTGKECKHGHLDERLTKQGNCIKCASIQREARKDKYKAWYSDNRESQKVKQQVYLASRKEATAVSRKAYRKRKREEARQEKEKYYRENKEEIDKKQQALYELKVAKRLKGSVRMFTPSKYQIGLIIGGWILIDIAKGYQTYSIACTKCDTQRLQKSNRIIHTQCSVCKGREYQLALPPEGTMVKGQVVESIHSSLARGGKEHYTGVPCKWGHYSTRSNWGTLPCRECLKIQYLNNRDACIAQATKWQKDNPDRVNMRNRARRGKIELATPPWVDDTIWNQIEAVYRGSRELTESTGVAHHVDHIVPIQHERVCGLHVPWNLKAIPADENLRKSNTFHI